MMSNRCEYRSGTQQNKKKILHEREQKLILKN